MNFSYSFFKTKLKIRKVAKLVLVVSGVAVFFVAIFGSLILPKQNLTVDKAQASTVNNLPTFGLGISQGQGENWGQGSGIPWSYEYQYLVTGWESWNSNGTFANNYANEKNQAGYIPVFPYYELLYFTGSCDNCGENQKDITHLNNLTIMTNYLNNFKLLMQRLGPGTYDGVTGFGKTAVVDIDPDLAGYAMQAVMNNANCFSFCTGQGNNPSFLKTYVNSTGITELTGKDGNGNFIYPDTYQGFNWALLHLRDVYAPNVKLAFHVSNWGTGIDIGQSHDSSLNITTEASKWTTFINPAGGQTVPTGVTPYDLLFSDPLDRDAGYYKSVYGNPNAWWDRLNVSYPNFHRYFSYLTTINQGTGKAIMLWQIPIGNQYFLTENNSNNHYQDNRVEYFLGQNLDFSTNHIQELKNAGIIGLLFGAGAGSQSSFTDQGPDGITNPAAICSTDGLSSGQICTTGHTSSYADDDGGYLRIMAGKFYNQSTSTPSPIPTNTFTPTSTPTVTPTKTPVPTLTFTPTLTPTNTVTFTPTNTLVPTTLTSSCLCLSTNVCSNSCTFNKSAGVSYPTQLSCTNDSLYSSSPSSTDKDSYCNRTKRTLGDADGSGTVDSLDYIYYVRAVNGGAIPPKINTDFNGDGLTSVSDRSIVVANIPK